MAATGGKRTSAQLGIGTKNLARSRVFGFLVAGDRFVR